MVTTIRVSIATRARLAALKSSRRESYDTVLNKLLTLIPARDDEGLYTDTFRTGLLSARLDLLAGRTLDHRELRTQVRVLG